MGFSEIVKLEVKKKANFRCCMCQGLIVDVHHIIPASDGGPDTIDNAAALCGGCHRAYGNNPDHRKTISQMRDHWNEICERQNNAMPASEKSIFEEIDGMRGDLKEIKKTLVTYFTNKIHDFENAESLETITQAASAVSSGTISSVFVACPKCNRPMTFLGNNDYRCEHCDGPSKSFIRAL